jgi:hypothetical protein
VNSSGKGRNVADPIAPAHAGPISPLQTEYSSQVEGDLIRIAEGIAQIAGLPALFARFLEGIARMLGLLARFLGGIARLLALLARFFRGTARLLGLLARLLREFAGLLGSHARFPTAGREKKRWMSRFLLRILCTVQPTRPKSDRLPTEKCPSPLSVRYPVGRDRRCASRRPQGGLKFLVA